MHVQADNDLVPIVDAMVPDVSWTTRQDERGLVFYDKGWVFSIRPVPQAELLELLGMAREAIPEARTFPPPFSPHQLLGFEIHIVNRGRETLHFHPDQVRLTRDQDLVATQVHNWDFMSPYSTPQPEQMEKLERLLQHASVRIAAREEHRQLVVFRPIRSPFRKRKLNLDIKSFFVGPEPITLSCTIKIRYQAAP